MTLRMADAITAGNLPAGFDAYAGYVNGNWPDYNAIVQRFPNAKHLSISVFLANTADCMDIEAGDASPNQAATFVRERKTAGVSRPCLYASISVMPQVVANLGGIQRSGYRLWSAHYGVGAHICGPNTCAYQGSATPACDGTQWASLNTYDESLLANDFFSLPQPPPRTSSGGQGNVLQCPRPNSHLIDFFSIGTDGQIWHSVWEGIFGNPWGPSQNFAVSNDPSASASPVGGDPWPGTLAGGYDSDGFLNLYFVSKAARPDGNYPINVMQWLPPRPDGSLPFNQGPTIVPTLWVDAAHLPAGPGPQGPAGTPGIQGPPGPSYDDTWIHNEFMAIKNAVTG